MAKTPKSDQSTQPTSASAQDSDMTGRLRREADAATEALQGTKEAVKQKAANYTAEAKERLAREGESMASSASASLHAFAEAVRSAGDELAAKDQSTASQFVREAASGLERLSSSLGNKKAGDVLEDVRNFGRSNPTAFIAGSVLAGLALGRFVRSSSGRTGGGTYAGSRETYAGGGGTYAGAGGNRSASTDMPSSGAASGSTSAEAGRTK